MRLVPTSIGGRLALGAAILITVALVIAGIGIGFVLERFVRDQIDQRLDGQVASIVSAITVEGGVLQLRSNVDAPPFDRPRSGWYWQALAGDQVLRSRSLAGETLSPPAPPPARRWRDMLEGRAKPSDGPGPRGEPLHFRLQETTLGGLDISIAVSAPREALARPMLQALVPLGASLVLLGACLAVASIVQLRIGLRPLARLKGELAAVRAGRISHIPPEQPAELLPLVGELNTLIDQNAEGLSRARLHVANLGHALNTPLASLELSLGEDGGERTSQRLALVKQMQERVRHHLGRARTAVLTGPARASTQLAPRIADIVAALSKIHADRKMVFAGQVEPGVRVACEQQDLDEMLGNILDNAFKWARARVELHCVTTAGKLCLAIEDDGPGLANDALPEALLPGRKLDESMAGTGFGLSITRELAELYGGGIALSRSRLGGLKAELVLPLVLQEQGGSL